MADLNKKTKYINIVVRKTDFNISDRDNLVLKWCKDNCELYAYIYHKDDLNIQGVKEHEHLHLVATLHESCRLSTTLHNFCEYLNLTTLGVEIDKAHSIEGSIQYLIHKNDPQKTQHDRKEIIHNYGPELDTLLDVACDTLTPQRLRALVRNCDSNYELIEALGLDKYLKYRKLISDIRDDFRIWNY